MINYKKENTRTIVIAIGTDGSGKTTTLKKITQSPDNNIIYSYYGLKNFKIPYFKYFFNKNAGSDRFSKYLLLPIEYTIRRLLLPRTGIILLDRVPGWAFTRKNSWIFKIYDKIIPNADLIVFLYGAPDIIHSRKPERSILEIQKDQEKWNSVFENYKAFKKIKIDTTISSVEETVETIQFELTKIIKCHE
ncbi:MULTISPECIES: hypothetical protein [Thalassospira]|uniref:Thymidylate kinase-like domain-containing protein n=2 Tax=Thalassospira TaxID=168934 RepID=A0A367WBP3_9PROT|nr:MULTISPECIES: hypothetical protein [Thalassospira]MDG4717687.1 hypothetical protein [Thalassospira sp. FZY0004]RCK38856.1 hypothetical protein TH19_03390 [Thalassospira profundimaris]